MDHLHAKRHPATPGAQRKAWDILLYIQRERRPPDILILDFKPPNGERIHFCCFSSPAWGILLGQPQQTEFSVVSNADTVPVSGGTGRPDVGRV